MFQSRRGYDTPYYYVIVINNENDKYNTFIIAIEVR